MAWVAKYFIGVMSNTCELIRLGKFLFFFFDFLLERLELQGEIINVFQCYFQIERRGHIEQMNK